MKKKVPFIQSPLNYTGGKYKLLPQLIELFPDDVCTFVDVFCGGGNVGANISAEHIVLNDIDLNVSLLLQLFYNNSYRELQRDILQIIDKYNLSMVSRYGYEFYGVNSSHGLGDYNKPKFLRLRNDFNKQQLDYNHYITLYVLIIYSFNNQIRFNNKGEFNLPVGKRDFNIRMQTKLQQFVDRLHTQQPAFTHIDFRDIPIIEFSTKDFFYLDPPYFITCATYNENGGWTEKDEKDLYLFLDKLQEQGIRFALSNVLSSKGKTNHILQDWLQRNKQRYKCHYLNYSYSNSNYQTIDKHLGSKEVLITNY